MKGLRVWPIVLLIACGRSDTVVNIPAGWVATRPPLPESDGAMCANAAMDVWSVRLSPDSDAVVILPAGAERMADTVRVDGGQLIGTNHGEFGGDVLWYPLGGSPVRVAQANLHHFVEIRDTIWGLIGLAHLSLNEGQLVRFDRTASGWQMTPVRDLAAAPEAFVRLPHDSLLVLAMGRVLRLSPDHGVEVLRSNRVWIYTYPQSIARDRRGVIYLGMRSAVARLTPQASGYAEDWLVPAECRHRVPTGTVRECRCER
jgi:hypothetical protein